MSKQHNYLNQTGNPVVSIINGVDHDIHRIEGILMLGYVLVLLSPLFAPITPPHILLPLMALCFSARSVVQGLISTIFIVKFIFQPRL
jgi:hypothetical protein